MGIKTDITLYTEGTPNGLKASIVLEELGLEYKVWLKGLHALLPLLTTSRQGRYPGLQCT
jgi:glutathione S-transferase